ncbi:MAG: hypothetical protein M5R36_10655 [Deltaproteobacteria bacterium]|nr:hypothetical protein [Deltaproteobacteria bacterium]
MREYQGYNVGQLKDQFRLFQNSRPDIVVIMAGQHWDEIGSQAMSPPIEALPTWGRGIQFVLGAVARFFGLLEPDLANKSVERWTDAFGELLRLVQSEDRQVIVIGNPSLEIPDRIRNRLRRSATQFKISYVPTRERLTNDPENGGIPEKTMLIDRIHPNKHGHQIIANRLVDAIVRGSI